MDKNIEALLIRLERAFLDEAKFRDGRDISDSDYIVVRALTASAEAIADVREQLTREEE